VPHAPHLEKQIVAAPLYEIFAILRQVLRDNDLELTPSTRFDDLTGWDSMDLITVVVEVECRFDLRIEMVELDRLVTIADLLRTISAKQALGAA
jgi:acyl carrier protein